MSEKIRLRIAPSPTGYLHIGTARTALFNYLYARKMGGEFILRIEDTDLERSDAAFEKDIIDGLRWLGIEWDEGPDIGGPHGPYRQSERGSNYRVYLEKLLSEGHLYNCYCTEGELQKEREDQLFAKQAPIYSGKCRDLSEDQKKIFEEEGRRTVLRFRVPEETLVVKDVIRGDISFDTSLIGDMVIAKNLDTPLYNFAVVVDDYEMKITHVIRGEDHISNTPKQILLGRALGFPVPEFGHLPLILNQDRSKLSKRQNKVSLLEYKYEGYIPEALLNFMVLLGWNPGGDREVYSEEELRAIFDIKDINKSGAVFDLSKLDWLNSHYIKEKNIDQVVELAWPFFEKAGYAEELKNATIEQREYIKKIITLERTRIKKISEITDSVEYFFKRPEYVASLLQWKEMSVDQVKSNIEFVVQVIDLIPEDDFDVKIESSIRESISEKGLSNGEVLWPMRTALTGREKSPSPFEVAQVLGKKETLGRLRIAIEKL